MKMVDIQEIETHFSKYTPLIKQGETIVVCEQSKPIAEIRRIQSTSQSDRRRPVGLGTGSIHVPDNFNEPDPNLEPLFYGAPQS